jgi:GNAT superfamily N-acetyltransferase
MARKLRWENAVFLERAGVLPIAKGLGLQRRMVRVRERWAQEVGASCCLTYAIYSNYPSIINLLRCGYRFYRPQTKWGADRSHYFRRDF